MVAGLSLALAAALTAAATPPGGALPLVPQPQEIGGPDEAPGGPLPPEGYFLRIDRSGDVTVRAADAAGRFYAGQTLRQLRAAFPDGAGKAAALDALRQLARPTARGALDFSALELEGGER